LILLDGQICVALLHADAACQYEVARRLFGELRILERAEASADSDLQGVDVIAIFGETVDVAFVERCLSNGKRVFLSATTLQSELIEPWLSKLWVTAEKSLTIGNPISSLPSRQCIQQQFELGKFGDIGLIRIHRWGSDESHPSKKPFYVPRLLQCELDHVLRYFHRSPKTLFATPYSNERGIMLHLVWPDGGMAQIDFIAELPNQQTYASFSLIGSRGAAYGDDHPNAQLIIGEKILGRVDAEVASPAAHMLLSYLAGITKPHSLSKHSILQPIALQPNRRSTLWSWYQSEMLARRIRESIDQRTCIQIPCDL
jgi:hypothetical protein